MDTHAVIDTLNELLALELHSLAPRLIESATFVSARSTRDFDRLQRLAGASRRHAAALAERIQSLGGVPQPTPPRTDSAGLHFQELAHARAAIRADLQSTIRACTFAAQRLSTAPQETRLIALILEDHHRSLELLSA